MTTVRQVHEPGLEQLETREPSDPEIAWEIAAALEQDEGVPHDWVMVAVHEGWVTLEGHVPWCYQIEAAEAAVCSVPGVRGVRNLLTTQPAPAVCPDAVKRRIHAALQRIAEAEACRIFVAVNQTTVTLSGTVHSPFEREELKAAARQVPGVTALESHLMVAS